MATQRQKHLHPPSALANGLTFLVWLATSLVAIYEVYVVRQLFFTILGRMGINYQTIEVLGVIVMLVSAGVALAAIVGVAEVHRQNVGQPRSLRLFAMTIGAELAIYWLFRSI